MLPARCLLELTLNCLQAKSYKNGKEPVPHAFFQMSTPLQKLPAFVHSLVPLDSCIFTFIQS